VAWYDADQLAVGLETRIRAFQYPDSRESELLIPTLVATEYGLDPKSIIAEAKQIMARNPR
jgi:hypothetical protein